MATRTGGRALDRQDRSGSGFPLGAVAATTPFVVDERERDLLTDLMVKVHVPELTMPPRPAWMSRGACRWNPEIDFFGEPWRLGPAQAVCRRCPVREECLAYAMEWEEPAGIWGGLTPNQRRAMRPKRGRGRPRKDASEVGARALAPDDPFSEITATPSITRCNSSTRN